MQKLNKYIILAIPILLSIGFFSFTEKAQAREYVTGFGHECHAGSVFGGNQVTCLSQPWSVDGQAWKWRYEGRQNDNPTPTVDICISENGVWNTGYCWNIQYNGGSPRARWEDNIPSNDMTGRYKYMQVQIIAKATTSNNNDFAGDFYLYGREVELFPGGVSPSTIDTNGSAVIDFDAEYANDVEFWIDRPNGNHSSSIVGSARTARDSFDQTYQHDVADGTGIARFKAKVWGPDRNANYVSLEHDFELNVNGVMTGTLTTNLDGWGRRCTLNIPAEYCHIQLFYNTTGATTVSIRQNGANWYGPTGTTSGSTRRDDPSPGSYTFTLYGNNGSQELVLDQATVVIEPPNPAGPPPPPPPGAPSCSPSSQGIAVNGTASFTATGGNGSFTWSAPYGSPTSGSGSSFSASYNASGFRQVTVTSGGQSAVCNVNVTATPPPSSNQPVGSFDVANNSTCTVEGWAYDPDTPTTSIQVEVRQTSGAGVGTYPTTVLRTDVNNVLGTTGNHGFNITLPDSFKDGVTRSLSIYGVNSNGTGASPTALTGSPKNITCTPPSIPPCQETVTFANTPYGYGDYSVNGQMNTNYWLADPYDSATNASNIDRSSNKIGISTRPGLNYPAGQSRGIYLIAPPGGTILSVSFNYNTNSYDPNMARMSVDYTGVSPYWYLNASGNLDTRGGAVTTVTFPGGGVAWTGLYYYQQNTWASAPVTFADFYNISMVVARPCNPSVSISANPITINAGQSSLISWSVVDANALSANITPSPGAVYLTNPPGHGGSGTFTTGSLSADRTYTITAPRWDNGQTMSASVTVNVLSGGGLDFTCNGPAAAGAGWDVHTGSYAGPIVASGTPSGSSHSLSAGTYYVTFRSVTGWTAPAQRTIVLDPGENEKINTSCDYTANQTSIQVNSLSNRTGAQLSGAWNITGPSVNRNRTGTTFTETDLTPNTAYTVTAQAIANCVSGESYGLPSPNPQTVNTAGAGVPVTHNLRYLQGQFNIHATVSGGNWSISPNPSGCTGTGSGTSVASYYRAPGNYTITAPTVAGFSAPIIRYGGNSYSSPHVLSVASGTNTDITIEYSASPPTPPSDIQFSRPSCNTINISWLDNSTNETGFRVYYRNTATGANNLIYEVGAAVATGTRVNFLWNNPPAGNLWFVVVSFIDYGGGNVVEGAASVAGPYYKQACTPDFNLSAKNLEYINGVSYSSSSTIKEGDILTFRIKIQNSGTDKARITTIADILGGNLERPSGGWNLRVDMNTDGVYSGQPGAIAAENAVNITGTEDPTITVNRNKCTTDNHNDCATSEDPGCISLTACNNWMFLIDARVGTTVPNIRTEVSNEAYINYTYPVGSGTNSSYHVETPTYLVQTSKPRVPQFREIAPQ